MDIKVALPVLTRPNSKWREEAVKQVANADLSLSNEGRGWLKKTLIACNPFNMSHTLLGQYTSRAAPKTWRIHRESIPVSS